MGENGATLEVDAGGVINLNGSGCFKVNGVDNTGNVIGNVTGNVTGNLTGNSAGTHTGPVVGNVTGNLTGAVTGNATTATTASAVSGNVTTSLITFGASTITFTLTNGKVIVANLPTTDPTTVGALWVDSNHFLKLSNG
jgi:outer membrane lipoprotein SlyB